MTSQRRLANYKVDRYENVKMKKERKEKEYENAASQRQWTNYKVDVCECMYVASLRQWTSCKVDI